MWASRKVYLELAMCCRAERKRCRREKKEKSRVAARGQAVHRVTVSVAHESACRLPEDSQKMPITLRGLNDVDNAVSMLQCPCSAIACAGSHNPPLHPLSPPSFAPSAAVSLVGVLEPGDLSGCRRMAHNPDPSAEAWACGRPRVGLESLFLTAILLDCSDWFEELGLQRRAIDPSAPFGG